MPANSAADGSKRDDLGLHAWASRLRHVRRVRDDDVKGTSSPVDEVGLDERDPIRDIMPRGISSRDGEGRRELSDAVTATPGSS